MAIKIRHYYDESQDKVTQATALDCSVDGQGRTKQSDALSCDINEITRRYEKTGLLPEMIAKEPRWGDFSEAPDYLAAQNLVLHAEAQFAALDAHIRNRFGNSPAAFLEFATNPENQKEMIKLGLATEKKQDSPPSQPAPAAAAAPSAASATVAGGAK